MTVWQDEATTAAFARALAPIEQARGLPNACYTEPGVFAAERRSLFETGWVAAGFGADISRPGDIRPVELWGLPMLLVRGRDGEIRVFHNVCSHRGMRLVDAPGHANGLIRCRYHAWSYGLDGRLRATPHVGGPGRNELAGFDRDCHGLTEIRSACWMDVVFVNPDGLAAGFETRIEPLAERWRDFAGRTLYPGAADSRFELAVACNWKLAVENYCESYHLPWVHPGLNSYSRLEDHYPIRNRDGDGFSGQGSTAYRPTLAGDGRAFAGLADIGRQWREGAEYVAFYPNLLLGVHRDHYFAVLLEPKQPDRTIERVAIGYFDESALGNDFAALRQANAMLWRQVFREDVFAVEALQQGRHSPAFEGGVFSAAMDGPTYDFHRWVAGRMLAP
ncbi:aromatic ring-hydroxylating oxygenase subunit alpha [Oceanibacterium hippocampi]|uniref:Salicylate 5-hydroxylase, large oxygenase component n=1 Tax=Oceanibacterium hippocampi TaxID=745714 RepID=A0A1Y5TZI0_9PROT|nr:aromatic ring-hydroxylating dioxygenase subunit alpha [Oceanibacterium hippocampi]SLN76730.1 Salicylate 5-hydroxylase, large oxygenase component [Oceanibacterium hippocampi]